MGDTFVISGLIQKRAELLGLAIDLEARARQARANLAHIDATILIFDPDATPMEIKGKKPTNRTGWFQPGEKSRYIREMLRTATGPLSAEDFVRPFMVSKGLDPEDKKLRQKLIQSWLSALNRMVLRGAGVERVGSGLGARWVLLDANG